MEEPATQWQNYEEVARFVLHELRERFGLDRVESKQSVSGRATTWELDARGVLKGGEGFLVIEVKDYPTRRVTQEQAAGLAYRIRDTGAQGAILVSPLPMQRGAQLVADAELIRHVQLAEWSTAEQFVARFLGELIMRPKGVSAALSLGVLTLRIEDEQGVRGIQSRPQDHLPDQP